MLLYHFAEFTVELLISEFLSATSRSLPVVTISYLLIVQALRVQFVCNRDAA